MRPPLPARWPGVPMPQFLASIWREPPPVTGDLALTGMLTLLALSVEGWTAAMVMLSGGLSYALIRTSPALAQIIRDLGFAFVDVRIKYRRELEAIRADLAAVRREAEQVKAEALEVAARVESEASRKRHDLADRLQVELLRSRLEIDTLKRGLGLIDTTHVPAINAVSDSVLAIAERVHVPLPSRPYHVDPLPPDGGQPPGAKP